MTKPPNINDSFEDIKVRRQLVLLRKVLESRDEDGNARFLDDREIITHAIEVFLTWEFEPKRILEELKKYPMTQQQEDTIDVLTTKNKYEGDSVSDYSTEEERNLQETARESTGDYDEMLANRDSSLEQIASDRFDSGYGDENYGRYPFEHWPEITYDGWPLLWNFYSRLLPAKITLTALGGLMGREKKEWVYIDGKNGFRLSAFDIVEELADKLRTHERQNKLGRTKKLSTGFPRERSADNLTQGLVEKRFKDKYVVTVRKSRTRGENIEGALAALGLITVKEVEESHYITMTELGKEFYKLPNPVLEGDYTHAFSDDEVKFITEKLIPQRELEDRLCKRALEIVRTFSEDETNNSEILNNAFKEEFEEFVKSYEGDPNHKERLERDFIELGISVRTTDGKKEKETPIEACRVATMGRLSELGLIKWKIGPNTSSEYTILEKPRDLL